MFFGESESKNRFERKHWNLSKALCEIVENFGLVGYSILELDNKFSMCNILMKIDKGNGYFYHPDKQENEKEKQIDYEAIENYFQSSVF